MPRLTSISPRGVVTMGKPTYEDLAIEMEKIRFIVLRKLLGVKGRFRLGLAWIILEPMMIALIYVFLFSVINSKISGELIIIGIGTYGVFSSSFRAGMSGLEDNGSFTAERVPTSVLIKAELAFSAVEGAIRAVSMLLLLFLMMEISLPGSLLFVPICALLSVISKAVGYNFVLTTRKSPDVAQLLDFVIRLMFFITPVLYPFSETEGIHRVVNSYNPLTYFIEQSRFVCGTVEVGLIPVGIFEIFFLTSFFLLSLTGAYRLDKFRWEVSTWN